MTNTKELYERYYSATINRFYSLKARRKLLTLFTSGYGIEEGSAEFAEIESVIESVEKIGIENLVDCKSFLLIVDSIPGKKELIKAVKAAMRCYEKYAESQRRTYSGAIDWRTEVYKIAAFDEASKLDVAYINYSQGMLDKAAKHFRDLVDSHSHVLSLEHLAVIEAKRGDYKEALFWMSVLSDVLENGLGIEAHESLAKKIEEAKAQLSENEITEIEEKAKRKVKQKFTYGKSGGSPIGFQPRN